MILRSVSATVLTMALIADAAAGGVSNPLNYAWAAVAGALWLSLVVDKKEDR